MSDAAPAASLRAILEDGAGELGIELDPHQVARMLALVRELADWSARFNLTAIREPHDIVRKHLLDSLTVVPYLEGESVADVGTGAGFPGLPLAIACPQRAFTLIEATTKKVRFLEHAVAHLELLNVSVVNARAENFAKSSPRRLARDRARRVARDQARGVALEHSTDAAPNHSAGVAPERTSDEGSRQRFDTVVARALASLAEFIRFAGHLAAPGGRLLAMKGQLPEAEIEALPKGWRATQTVALRVPGLDAARHLVILRASADGRPRSR